MLYAGWPHKLRIYGFRVEPDRISTCFSILSSKYSIGLNIFAKLAYTISFVEKLEHETAIISIFVRDYHKIRKQSSDDDFRKFMLTQNICFCVVSFQHTHQYRAYLTMTDKIKNTWDDDSEGSEARTRVECEIEEKCQHVRV